MARRRPGTVLSIAVRPNDGSAGVPHNHRGTKCAVPGARGLAVMGCVAGRQTVSARHTRSYAASAVFRGAELAVDTATLATPSPHALTLFQNLFEELQRSRIFRSGRARTSPACGRLGSCWCGPAGSAAAHPRPSAAGSSANTAFFFTSVSGSFSIAAVMVPTAFCPARCASQNSALPLICAVEPSAPGSAARSAADRLR